jgi:Flp pilus assembly protein TadG
VIARLAPARRRIAADVAGATIVEFALIVPLLIGLLMMILEVGYQNYVEAMVQGALAKASRLTTVGNTTAANVSATIKAEVRAVVPAEYVTVSTRRYYNFSNVGKPEKITSDTDPRGTFNLGDCFEDANNNGIYDATPGDDGVGSADDVIFYTATVRYPNLTPVGPLMGWTRTRTVTETTLVRNQPFTSRAAPTVVCTKP